MKTLLNFTEEEFQRVVTKVKEREGFKKTWQRISPSETERVSGFMAEYAVKAYLGKNAHIDEGHYIGGAGNCDLWFNDKRISIRSTEKIANNLLVRPGEEKDVDCFVLCISRPNYVWIYGWIPTKEYLEKAGLTDPKGLGKPCWLLSKNELRPLSDWHAWLYNIIS